MNLTSLFIVIAIASSWSLAASAERDSVRVGGSMVKLAAPSGYVDLCSSDMDAAELFPSFIPSSNALLACYTTPTDWEEWKNQDGGLFKSYLIATVMKGTINRDTRADEFAQFRGQMVATLESLYQSLGPEIRQQINMASVTVTEALGKHVSTTLDAVTPVGMFDSGSNSFSTVWIVKATHNIDGATVTNTQVQISSAVHINGKVLVLFTYGHFEIPEDIETYKAVAKEWVSIMKRGNA